MRNRSLQGAFRTSFAYWLISSLWILASDRAVLLISLDPSTIGALSTYKGWAFVTLTALLLFATLRSQFGKWEEEVTTRRRAEEALRESELRFSRVFQTSPVAISIVRLADSKFIDVNDAFLELSGFAREEVISHTSDELGLWQQSDRITLTESLRRKKRLQNVEMIGRRRSGEACDLLASLEAIELTDGTCIVEMLTDITQRKRSEQALNESEERYRSLFENNQSVMLLIDPDSGDIVDANPAACAFYGYARDVIQQLRITDINQLTSEQVFEEMKKAKAEHRRQFYFLHRLAGGDVRDVEVYSGPITVRGKSLLYSIVHDITDRKIAEKALVESLGYYRTLSQTIPFGMQVVDATGTILYTNGRLPSDRQGRIDGQKCWELYKDDHKRCWSCPLESLSPSGSTAVVEVGGVAGGRVFQIHHTGMMYGRKPAVLEIFQDITERKNMEEALRRQAALIDLSPDAIMCRKQDGTITFWSRGAEKLYGWSSTEAIGQTTERILNTVFPEPFEAIMETLRKAGQWTGELIHTTRDGRKLTVESRWLHEPGTDELMESNVDITERKQSEEQIGRSLQEKELLLKEVHHRVKNNMQIISSMLRLQSRTVTDPVARSMLDESQNRIRSMSLIHEQLYATDDLARISPHDYIERLTQNLVRSYAGGGSRIRIDLRIDPDLSLDLDTAIPCGLIINELVSNALKYAFPGGTEGTISLSLRRAGEEKYELMSGDNGIGLPEGFEVANSKTLGLQLVQSLVRELRGIMHIDNRHGTRFTITFSGAKYSKRI